MSDEICPIVKTKLLAERKAEKISNMIGYPEYIANNTALNEKYKKLEINQVRSRWHRMLLYKKGEAIYTVRMKVRKAQI